MEVFMGQGRGYNVDHKLRHKIEDEAVFYLQEYNLDHEVNNIYLFGEEAYNAGVGIDEAMEPGVEYMMANRFIKNINYCMRRNPNTPILIHMKTCGGFWEEGMAIYNAIKACPNPVTILNYTHARSMSSLIFQAANKRVMMPDSTFMYHEGTWGFSGTVKQANTEIEQLNLTGERMLSIYVEAMKRNGKYSTWAKQRIKDKLISNMQKKEEVYLNDQDAVYYGLADEVFGSNGGYDWTSLTEYTEEQLER
jgi:ATP-dependent protease ClpP protease subunit